MGKTPVLTITEKDYTEEKEKNNINKIQQINNDIKSPKNMQITNKKTNTKQSCAIPSGVKISRDTMDGNLPNFCQTTEGMLERSFMGKRRCNYCGKPNHKRQDCLLKAVDRVHGKARQMHPARKINISIAQEISEPLLEHMCNRKNDLLQQD